MKMSLKTRAATLSPTARLLYLLIACSSCLVVSAGKKDEAKSNPCRLYMAQSSVYTPNKPKFGLYAGVEFQPNETLSFASELGVPLADFFEAPNKQRGQYEKDVMDFVENFVWASQTLRR